MRIIPVIDLLDGKVVQAVAGRREEYKPIKSVLTKASDPLSMAMAFQNLGLEEIYIADLNAICSRGHNLNPIGQIASQSRMGVIVDAGFRRADEAEAYVRNGINKIVLATETLESFEEIPKIVDVYDLPVTASIDLKDGRVVAKSRHMKLPLTELIRKFEDKGASEIIILSLDRVGTSEGPNRRLVEEALNYATVPVLVGGGVRNIADIRYLKKSGAAGVLLATALHKGAITKDDLNQL